MTKKMQQKKIILFIIIIFVLSSVYLLAIGAKFNDTNFSSGWWSVYFVNPKDETLNFTIENHNGDANFHYVIMDDKEKIKESDITVKNDEQRNIKPDVANLSSGKVTIEVSANGSEKQSIYKNF